jgi:hypothetical protein
MIELRIARSYSNRGPFELELSCVELPMKWCFLASLDRFTIFSE